VVNAYVYGSTYIDNTPTLKSTKTYTYVPPGGEGGGGDEGDKVDPSKCVPDDPEKMAPVCIAKLGQSCLGKTMPSRTSWDMYVDLEILGDIAKNTPFTVTCTWSGTHLGENITMKKTIYLPKRLLPVFVSDGPGCEDLSFGDVKVGESKVMSYFLQADNVVSSVLLKTTGDFRVSTNNATFSKSAKVPLEAGADKIRQLIYVKFVPRTAGSHTGTVVGTTYNGKNVLTLRCSGKAIEEDKK
jgi:hypothetical protein